MFRNFKTIRSFYKLSKVKPVLIFFLFLSLIIPAILSVFTPILLSNTVTAITVFDFNRAINQTILGFFIIIISSISYFIYHLISTKVNRSIITNFNTYIYYNVKNPKTIVQIPLEKTGVKEEVLISILLVTGVLILYVGLLGVFNKKPKKAGVNTVLQVFGIAGFVLIYSGIVMIISINESFDDYIKVKATVLTSIEGNESSVDFTEVEYEIDGVRYVNSMETYNSTHYKGKKVKMYVNKEDYNQIKPPADYTNSIVPIIVGAFLVIIGNIPLVKKLKEKKLKKRLMQEGEYRRVKVVSLKYDKKIKINGTFPQFAEVELIEDEKTFTFKSDSYVNLIAYSQEKQLLEADLYFDPMDNRNYVIIFDFEKKTKSV